MVWGLWGELMGCMEGTPVDMSGQQDCGGQTAPASLFSFRLRSICHVWWVLPTMWVLGTELRSWELGMSVPACSAISIATVSFLASGKK